MIFSLKIQFGFQAMDASLGRCVWDNNARRQLEERVYRNADHSCLMFYSPAPWTTWDGHKTVGSALIAANDAARRVALKSMVQA